MARILENEQGGRRMIRLTSDDIVMVLSMVQQEFKGIATSYDTLKQRLEKQPFYLPEELA